VQPLYGAELYRFRFLADVPCLRASLRPAALPLRLPEMQESTRKLGDGKKEAKCLNQKSACCGINPA